MWFWNIAFIYQNIIESAWKVHLELETLWRKVSSRLWAAGYHCCWETRHLINYQIHLHAAKYSLQLFHLLHPSTPQSRVRNPWGSRFPISRHFLSSTALYFIKKDRILVSTPKTVTPSLERALLCSIKAKTAYFLQIQIPMSASLVLTRLRVVQCPHFWVLRSTCSCHLLSYKHHAFLSNQIWSLSISLSLIVDRVVQI